MVGGLAELGQAEIEDLDQAVGGDEDVLGLQVAVDDAAAVRRGQAAGDLLRVRQGLAQRQRAAAERAAQRLAVEQLGDDVGPPVGGADVVDRDDVRVVERGGGARFQLEAVEALRIGREARRQHLDGDVAAEARIAGPIDLAHAAGAEQRDDLVGPEP